MKPFLKLLLLFVVSNLLLFAIFYGDQLGHSASNIGGGGYSLTYLYYLLAVIFFLFFFNLFLIVSSFYLKSKARNDKGPKSFLWISVPALLVAISMFIRQF